MVAEGDGGETSEPGKNKAHMGHSLQHLALPQRHADPFQLVSRKSLSARLSAPHTAFPASK